MRILGQQQLADLFGVTQVTINDWQREGLPVAQRGGPNVPNEYDSAECVRWLLDRERRKVQGENPKDAYYRVKTEQAALELARERGLLVPAAKLEPTLRGIVTSAREFLRGECARLARLTEGKPVEQREQLIAEAHDEFLRRLSRWHAPADPAPGDAP